MRLAGVGQRLRRGWHGASARRRGALLWADVCASGSSLDDVGNDLLGEVQQRQVAAVFIREDTAKVPRR
jgi:hypothetical protein